MKKFYMFPGQGSQFVGMGENLFDLYPELIEEADKILGYSIKNLCLFDEENNLNNTAYTQPALYVINCLSYLETRKKEDAPDYVLGHSLGEYSALFAANVFDFKTGLKLVKKRGELMNTYGQGGMIAVIGEKLDNITTLLKKQHLEGIDIANINSYDQIVLSGLEEQITVATDLFSSHNISVIPLPVSGAFHSRYMQDAKIEYEDFLEDFTFNTPSIPTISNVNGSFYNKNNVKELLVKQVVSPVNWVQSIEYLLNKYSYENLTVKEVGPKKVLTKLYDKIVNSQPRPFTHEDIVPKDITKKVELWNEKFKIGTKVYLKNIGTYSNTKSKAYLLFDKRPVIYVTGYNGYFDLDDIRVCENEF